jgi:hypothetical protein
MLGKPERYTSGVRENSRMIALTLCKRLVRTGLATVALLGTSDVLANEVSDLDARAAAEYNRGLDARDAGQNGAACQHFRNSAVLYENSIYAMMSHSMRTEEDRDVIKRAAEQQQGSANGAKARAKEVCGRPDGPALTSSSASSASDGVDWNTEKKLDLQRTHSLAQDQYKQSVRLWEAGDRPGACAMIKASTANYAKVVDAVKSNKALEDAFFPVEKLYENAAIVAEVRDQTICSNVTDAQRDSLQRDAAQAITQNKEADRLYAAKDYAGACAAARLSADAYDRLTSAMRSNPALEAAFDDPAVIYGNAKIMATDRDRYYCTKVG